MFRIVLLVALAVGGFYLYQTQNFFPPKSIDEVTQKASQNCKKTGFKTTEDGKDYLADLIKRSEANSEKYKNKELLQIIDLGNTCWGIWTGNKDGEGIIFWEDSKGKIYQANTKIAL